ncbi:11856_t:CDS:10 [Diversispora eburnea]|uniref:11856_t:CDS:1 n=1 Tax=Diversispora eburnea TaxID=1213867 RepID=A0A9N8V6K7_9GLOM|nr:11856_t:CDS:10 [Diversispora eburnea]
MTTSKEDGTEKSSVQVAIRIRPISTELNPNLPTRFQRQILSLSPPNTILVQSEKKQIFILAYGQTSSGKTHTMGTADNSSIPFESKVSFIEIYNEDLIDLFGEGGDSDNKSHVTIREDLKGNILWSGLQEIKVNCVDELMGGSQNRQVGATQMNAQSSRSHAIFSVTMTQQKYVQRSSSPTPPRPPTRRLSKRLDESPGELVTVVSKFHFVDLAGSERLKRTSALGDRAKEGISINSGLLALGNVISALGDPNKAKHTTHVPYRDSKLTRLLQDSLGGNAQTLMIACVSSTEYNLNETVNTLKYANRARNIKNNVSINQEEAGWNDLDHLQTLVNKLRTALTPTTTTTNHDDDDSTNNDSTTTIDNNSFQEVVEPVIEEYEKSISALESQLALNRAALAHAESVMSDQETRLEYAEQLNFNNQKLISDLKQKIINNDLLSTDQDLKLSDKKREIENQLNGNKIKMIESLEFRLKERESSFLELEAKFTKLLHENVSDNNRDDDGKNVINDDKIGDLNNDDDKKVLLNEIITRDKRINLLEENVNELVIELDKFKMPKIQNLKNENNENNVNNEKNGNIQENNQEETIQENIQENIQKNIQDNIQENIHNEETLKSKLVSLQELHEKTVAEFSQINTKYQECLEELQDIKIQLSQSKLNEARFMIINNDNESIEEEDDDPSTPMTPISPSSNKESLIQDLKLQLDLLKDIRRKYEMFEILKNDFMEQDNLRKKYEEKEIEVQNYKNQLMQVQIQQDEMQFEINDLKEQLLLNQSNSNNDDELQEKIRSLNERELKLSQELVNLRIIESEQKEKIYLLESKLSMKNQWINFQEKQEKQEKSLKSSSSSLWTERGFNKEIESLRSLDTFIQQQHESKISDLENEIFSLNQQKSLIEINSNSEISKLINEIKELELKLVESHMESENLKSKILILQDSESDQKSLTLQLQFNSLELELSNLRNSAKKQNEYVFQLEEELQSIKLELSTYKENIKNIKSTEKLNESFTTKAIKERDEKILNLIKERDENQLKILNLDLEIKSIKEQKVLNTLDIENSKLEIENLKKKCDQLEKSLDETKKESLDMSNKNLINASIVEELTIQLEKFQNEAKLYHERVDSLEVINKQLESEKNSQLVTNEDLLRQIKNLGLELEGLTSEYTEIANKYELVDLLASKQKNRINDLETDNLNLSQDLTKLKNEFDISNNNNSSSIKDLNEKISQLEQEKDCLLEEKKKLEKRLLEETSPRRRRPSTSTMTSVAENEPVDRFSSRLSTSSQLSISSSENNTREFQKILQKVTKLENENNQNVVLIDSLEYELTKSEKVIIATNQQIDLLNKEKSQLFEQINRLKSQLDETMTVLEHEKYNVYEEKRVIEDELEEERKAKENLQKERQELEHRMEELIANTKKKSFLHPIMKTLIHRNKGTHSRNSSQSDF